MKKYKRVHVKSHMRKVKMVGKSDRKSDSQRHAKRAGWRRSKSGKRYYENRRNRSDSGYWL